MMNCSKCSYTFCWICGLHTKNPIHMLTIIECEGINFKLPDIREKYFLFFPVVLLSIIFMPLIIIVTIFLFVFLEWKIHQKFGCLRKANDRIFDKIDKGEKAGIRQKILMVLFLIFVLLSNLIYWSVILSTLTALIFVPLPIVTVLGILAQLNILYRWRPYWLHFSLCPSFEFKKPQLKKLPEGTKRGFNKLPESIIEMSEV